MVVTFTDGHVERYRDVRFPINLSAEDPTKIVGNTVYTETDEQSLTLLNVRSFVWDH